MAQGGAACPGWYRNSGLTESVQNIDVPWKSALDTLSAPASTWSRRNVVYNVPATPDGFL